jgi:hypothetical protein
VEYSVIDLRGEDPNGVYLLGLDNTTGKDNGNLRFNDILGGFNAETEEDGLLPYGGVFVSSLLAFSPTLHPGLSPLASAHFDEIFAPVCPLLGGQPATGGELASLGHRDLQVQEAARVFVNLVAGTIAHEIGHSLGLAFVADQPDRLHNPGDNPGWIMDEGIHRPFAERAEIDGQGPEFFGEPNYRYLQQILPED